MIQALEEQQENPPSRRYRSRSARAHRRSRAALPRQPAAHSALARRAPESRRGERRGHQLQSRPRLDKRQIAALAGGEWIRRSQNLLITGATGSGKTWIACALAQQTCRQGASVLYWRVPRLIEELRVAHGDGSYIKFLKTIAKASLIVLDDWVSRPLDARSADLLEILDDRSMSAPHSSRVNCPSIPGIPISANR